MASEDEAALREQYTPWKPFEIKNSVDKKKVENFGYTPAFNLRKVKLHDPDEGRRPIEHDDIIAPGRKSSVLDEDLPGDTTHHPFSIMTEKDYHEFVEQKKLDEEKMREETDAEKLARIDVSTSLAFQHMNSVHNLTKIKVQLSTTQLGLTLLSVLCVVIELELFYQANFKRSFGATFFKCVLTFLSGVQCFYMHQYYKTEIAVMKKRSLIFEETNLYLSKYGLFYLADMMLMAYHVPPFFDYGEQPLIPDKYQMFVFARLCLFYRLLGNYAGLLGSGSAFVSTLSQKVRITCGFVLRALFFKFPIRTSLICIIVVTFISSYSFYVFEREDDPETFTFENTIWLALVTMTTVGYGDYSPLTTLGRLTAVVAAVCGLVLTAIVITIIHRNISLNPLETQVVSFVESNSERVNMRNQAARVISGLLRKLVLVRKLERGEISQFVGKLQLFVFEHNLLVTINRFRLTQRELSGNAERHKQEMGIEEDDGIYDEQKHSVDATVDKLVSNLTLLQMKLTDRSKEKELNMAGVRANLKGRNAIFDELQECQARIKKNGQRRQKHFEYLREVINDADKRLVTEVSRMTHVLPRRPPNLLY
eukprot:GFYU01005791.1.p1 GENE.GFYU01005791.1~~GFYU01005791.1.p1  ORF type:complete len:593 (-),score=134.40 GFYU01005791.1:103-1881(-)